MVSAEVLRIVDETLRYGNGAETQRSKRFRTRLLQLRKELIDRRSTSKDAGPEPVPLDMNCPKNSISDTFHEFKSGKEFADALLSGHADRIVKQLQEQVQIMTEAVNDFKLPEVRKINFRYWSKESLETTAPKSNVGINDRPTSRDMDSVRRRYEESKTSLLSYIASQKRSLLDDNGGSPTPPRHPFGSLDEDDGGSPMPPSNPLEALPLLGVSHSHPTRDQFSSFDDANCKWKDPIADTSVSQKVSSCTCTEIGKCTEGYPETNDTSGIQVADFEEPNELSVPENNDFNSLDDPNHEIGIQIPDFELRDDLSVPEYNEGKAQSSSVHPSKQKKEKAYRKKQRRKSTSKRQSLAGSGTSLAEGVRRSTRIRSRPLEYWKGERFLYGRIHKSLVTVIGIKKYDSLQAGNKSLKVKSFVGEEFQNLVELAGLH